MFRPAIPPWVKKRRHVLCQRIDPRQIGSLVEIAAMTCQGEILCIIGAAVLFGHNVLDVMDQLAMVLMQPAILATLASPQPYEVSDGGIHLLLSDGVQLL